MVIRRWWKKRQFLRSVHVWRKRLFSLCIRFGRSCSWNFAKSLYFFPTIPIIYTTCTTLVNLLITGNNYIGWFVCCVDDTVHFDAWLDINIRWIFENALKRRRGDKELCYVDHIWILFRCEIWKQEIYCCVKQKLCDVFCSRFVLFILLLRERLENCNKNTRILRQVNV